jgi:hypothetical protein
VAISCVEAELKINISETCCVSIISFDVGINPDDGDRVGLGF